jgi:glycosyltransferase involved in cell wall biosynthesis
VRLLVAIPCLNEEKTIAKVIGDIPTTIKNVNEIVVLVIDDGSKDNTISEATKAGAKIIKNPRNLGVGHSFQTAVSYATQNYFDIMVNIDGDGQFNPKDIVKIVTPIIDNKADFVTASRFIDKTFYPDMPKVKFLGNLAMSKLISTLSGQKYHDVSCGFRAYSNKALLNLNLIGKFTYTQETFLDLSFKKLSIVEVPIKVEYFQDRKSRVASNLFSYAYKTSKIIFRSYRDYFPLRFFWALAAGVMLPALALGIFFIFNYFQTGGFKGHLWAGFSAAFLAMVALSLAILGIVADMLDRQRITMERILFYQKYTLQKNKNIIE